MPKSLGQIHTVNYEFLEPATDQQFLIDLPGQLTEQLQHMVRMMTSVKLVGMDFTILPVLNADPFEVAISGTVEYYAPTQGRVAALKGAYQSVRRMMKISGVNPKDNINYDFRPPISDPAGYENGADFLNQAAIDDSADPTCLANGPGTHNVFGVYNQQIGPRFALAANPGFEAGFDIGLRTTVLGADWVLNDGAYLQSSIPTAIEERESIPFAVSYSNTGGEAAPAGAEPDIVTNWNWRPDPALYLAILTGQLHIDCQSVVVGGPTPEPEDEVILACAFHVAGWKSILSSNKKKRRRSRKKSHGRKRRSKK